MTHGFLSRMKKHKEEAVEASEKRMPLEDVEGMAREANTRYPVAPFRWALETAMESGYGLIAEVKYASPASGQIRDEFDTAGLARAYEGGGATCISVLTELSCFNGSNHELHEARKACNLPVLCKDFFVSPYQVVEARSFGADCILIIMAMVEDSLAKEIKTAADSWNMDVLAEVHTLDELSRAINLGFNMIGINNRNLQTLKVSLNTTRNLAKHVPNNCLIVSASGLRTPHDLADMASHGVRCFLVGEALMKQPDVKTATKLLLANPSM